MEGDREIERSMRQKHWSTAFCTLTTWDEACNSGMCLDWEPNWWSLGSCSTTEQYRTGHVSLCFLSSAVGHLGTCWSWIHCPSYSRPIFRVIVKNLPASVSFMCKSKTRNPQLPSFLVLTLQTTILLPGPHRPKYQKIGESSVLKPDKFIQTCQSYIQLPCFAFPRKPQ